MTATVFRLKVQRIQQTCLFELAWGNGQQLSVTLTYPESLTLTYQDWQRAYLSFYQSVPLPISPPPASNGSNAADATTLRGRVGASGNLVSPPNWQAKLVQAEAALLYEFHQWLRGAELFEIRREIARSAAAPSSSQAGVNLFLTCHSLELERLPWEAWEIGTELGTGKIRIARTPMNIRAPVSRQDSAAPNRRARILAILGDDTGLNFQADREAVRSLAPLATVEFLGWQVGQDAGELKRQICEAIADGQGWDGLFFAGHSNETALTGGELAIAPGVTMTVSEMTRSLTVAKERGLTFAIFNSCSGLSIAQALIDLGLGQVVIMREPIHNRVAQTFLLEFLRSLAASHDIQDAVLSACQFLKLERHLTYPSAYLIPSLFCHPEATLFRIQPGSWKQQLRPWIPTRIEAIALGAILCLSLWPSAQDWLLEQRVWLQAAFRDTTGQLPPAAEAPVRLVQIDEKSIRKAGISDPNPIDRAYLAKLIDRLAGLDAKVIGLDYVLDRQQPGKDQILARSLQSAVEQHNTWFVFGARSTPEGEVGISPEAGFASLNWSLQAYIAAFPWYMELLPTNTTCVASCPFAYVLALAQMLHQEPVRPDLPQPHLQSQTDFRTQVIAALRSHSQSKGESSAIAQLRDLRLAPLNSASQRVGQLWLQPILDFSIPPQRVYEAIPAWQILESAPSGSGRSHQSVVIIAPGGYEEAGITAANSDNFPVPAGIRYWRGQQESASPSSGVFTGSEAHAYMVYQLLTQRLVIPLPDLWLVGIAALLGKGLTVRMQQRQKLQGWFFRIGSLTVVYWLVSWQLYLTGGILLPCCLPSVTIWSYVLPRFVRRKLDDKQ